MSGSFEAMARADFSEACERNKGPILEVLQEAFVDCSTVLEIGSGTGQHAVYFSRNLPNLRWQPSDTPDYLDGLVQRIAAEAPGNVDVPIELDVRMQPWPVGAFDGVFSANSLHFMSWHCAENFFRGVGEALSNPGVLCVYGPFRYDGQYTSDSNLNFDRYLRDRDPERGVRDFEAVDELANKAGLTLFQDAPMPANNQLLVWRR